MKKVLIITYYWPPAGGPGVQRWLKFTRYLPEFGFEPVVYAPKNADYPIVDTALASELSPELEVMKKPIFEPYFLAKVFSKKQIKNISSGIIADEDNQGLLQRIMLFIRGNFFIPDARKFWVKPSVRFLEKYISANSIQTIITTGPPHSMHLIGLHLKKKLNIDWLADFRDPWTQIGYHKNLKLTAKSEKKHLKLEKEILDNADKILVTSFTTQQEFKNKTRTPVKVITNGFDIEINKKTPENNKFVISHIGSLLSGRNPENLWKCLGELVKENKKFSDDLELHLVGKISDQVIKSVKENGLEKHLFLQGYVTHSEAVNIQQNSDVLLLIEIDSRETRGIIPGKIFEYLAARRPILAIGPENWDAARIISETQSGTTYTYRDTKELKNKLLQYYDLFLEKKLNVDSTDLQKYSRRYLTGLLAEEINTL